MNPDPNTHDPDAPSAGSLSGIRVLDIATIFAGPMAAAYLGDAGADVIKIEHPRGDAARHHGYHKDGIPLWWKVVGRNKRTMTLNLSNPEGQEILKRLVQDADVLIENFRPGTLEKWGLAPETLQEINPRLIVLRVTGFGQTGPYARRAGFGTIAESMSGLAYITGYPDGPPTLPSLGFADAVTGMVGAISVLNALYHRDARGGAGQVIDLAIVEAVLQLMGAQATNYDALGIIQERTGNRSFSSAPRNVYRTKDQKWVALSTSASTIAERVMRLVGRPDYIEQDWFKTGAGRVQHADALDEAVGGWISERTHAEVVAAFVEADAAIASVNNIEDVLNDPQYQARESFLRIEDSELGSVLMPNVPFRMVDTPMRIRWGGRPLGADTEEILEEIRIPADQIDGLRERGAL